MGQPSIHGINHIACKIEILLKLRYFCNDVVTGQCLDAGKNVQIQP